MTPDVLIRDRKAAEKHDAAKPTQPARTREVSLDDKYELDEGLVFLTGIHALVRVDARPDARRPPRPAWTPATMVSGYQGSPLGGFDKELGARRASSREALGIAPPPALNEELGATTVWG